MSVAEILLLGNPILRTKCRKVSDFTDPSIGTTVADLRDTLHRFRATHGFGRGIAAPQIGVTRRIIFIDTGDEMPIINPKMIAHSRQTMTIWDDCFSFPDILVQVKRYLRITVEYQDDRGKKQRIEAGDGLSELLQHEIDHLDGILAIDRAIDTAHIVLRSEWAKKSAKEHELHLL